jgi:DNA (cytosine-5)-methyltransferase 1
MKTSEGVYVKDEIIEDLKELGYKADYQLLVASDYGVPQNRKRVIFIGRKNNGYQYPQVHPKKVGVGEALSNIPDTDKEEYLPPENSFQKLMSNGKSKIFNHEPMNHSEPVLNRIRHVPQGGNWQDIPPKVYNVGGNHSNNYRRLDPNEPSITIKHATKSMIISPYFDRVITAREAARLQSFPDDFVLEGTKFEQHQQLANAVPPLLGVAIAKSVRRYLDEKV